MMNAVVSRAAHRSNEELARAIKQSLVEVLARDGVALRRDGRGRWRARCPLHPDVNPSFVLWEDGNWYCFGCDRGGDAVTYVALRDGLDARRDFKRIVGLLGLDGAQDAKCKVQTGA